jgi:rod shape-determining protein MreD
VSLLLLLIPSAIAALLDLTVFTNIRIGGTHPSLSVALVAVWAVLRRRDEAMVLAPATGLFLGLLGDEPLGAAILGLSFAVVLAGMRDPDMTEGRFFATGAVTAAAAAAYTLIIALTEAVVGRSLPGPDLIWKQVLGSALLTLPLAAVLYLPLARAAWQPREPGTFRRF